MTTPTFLFISGSNRSGTTWLTRLLDHHPQARVEGEVSYVRPGESWIEPDAIRRWTATGTGATYWRGWDADRVRRIALRGAIEAVWLDALNPGPHVRVVGDKAPVVYAEACDTVHELFPDSQFLDVVRDGRDVAVSRVFKGLGRNASCPWFDGASGLERARSWHIEGRRDDGDPPPLLHASSVRRLAREWRYAVECGERSNAVWGDAYRRVYYEKLLLDTAGRLASLYRFLGLADADSEAARTADRCSFRRVTGRRPGDADPAAFARSGMAGEWRRYFTPELEAIFEEVAGDTLRRHGYLDLADRSDAA